MNKHIAFSASVARLKFWRFSVLPEKQSSRLTVLSSIWSSRCHEQVEQGLNNEAVCEVGSRPWCCSRCRPCSVICRWLCCLACWASWWEGGKNGKLTSLSQQPASGRVGVPGCMASNSARKWGHTPVRGLEHKYLGDKAAQGKGRVSSGAQGRGRA